MVKPTSTYLLSMYSHYKNNLLPYPGGILNQPRGYVQAMAIIDNYVNKPVEK